MQAVVWTSSRRDWLLSESNFLRESEIFLDPTDTARGNINGQVDACAGPVLLLFGFGVGS